MNTASDQAVVIVTGACGGIGQALVREFHQANYAVIATDIAAPAEALPCEHFIQADLQKTVANASYANEIFAEIRKKIAGRPLHALVNNAAIQILGKVEELTRDDWRNTLDVNLLAPFFWVQALLPELEDAFGSVVNIGSIHARLTKKKFAAYATSKAAISGLTRAMAIELGDRIRINTIEPAAIDTPMLRAGFAGDNTGFNRLQQFHPTGQIGTPEQIAELTLMLVRKKLPFLNGSNIAIDGGIGAVLHDPGATA